LEGIANTPASTSRRVPALDHKILDHSVENDPVIEFFVLVFLVHIWVVALGKGHKIGHGHWGAPVFQLDDDVSLCGLDIRIDALYTVYMFRGVAVSDENYRQSLDSQ